MTNLSQQRREEMLAYLDKLRDLHGDDESLRLINQIQSEINTKRYGLIWEEHSEHVDEMLVDNIPVFVDVPERTIVSDKSKKFNFLLEGDNLHSLKLLRKTHTDKIDLIYIDPPYNTGNTDFRYDDSYVDGKDAFAHSKWLSFMERRLRISRELLKDTGMIFISIDDNELFHLKLLCDSVFGEKNYLTMLVWQSTPGSNTGLEIKTVTEYVLVYANNKNNCRIGSQLIECDSSYKLSDEHVQYRGPYKLNKMDRRMAGGHYSESLNYEIELPDGSVIYPGGESFKQEHWNWRWSKTKLEWGIENGFIVFKKQKDKWAVYFKQYFLVDNSNNQISRAVPYQNLLKIQSASSATGTNELLSLLGAKVFDYPKPLNLITHIIGMYDDSNALVLDFFAGSGTTGHAVQQLNKVDGGNRTYILCTNNENNICEEVTYQRLSKIQEELPHNLRYYRTDFVAKHNVEDEDYSITDVTLEHIRELIELEHQTYIDGVNNALLLDNDEIQYVLMNVAHGANVYTTSWIFLEAEDLELIEEKEINIIIVPDYYFENELIEVGEL